MPKNPCDCASVAVAQVASVYCTVRIKLADLFITEVLSSLDTSSASAATEMHIAYVTFLLRPTNSRLVQSLQRRQALSSLSVRAAIMTAKEQGLQQQYGAKVKLKQCEDLSNEVESVPETKIDRALFDSKLDLYALKTPPRLCHVVRKLFKTHLLTMPRTHVVVKPGGSHMLLLSRYLSKQPDNGSTQIPPRGNVDSSCIENIDELLARLRAVCTSDAVDLVTATSKKTKKKKKKDGEEETQEEEVQGLQTFLETLSTQDVTTWSLNLSYQHCSIDHVLTTLLPQGMTIPSSFEGVGHIAHLNLRDEHRAWQSVIGQVMLDKLGPRIKTVVNKLESTGGPYRTFAMEVIGGEKRLTTSVRENNCVFHMDFERVYWNSRLETEHRRIVELIRPQDIFVDAFCGIGPFVLPTIKRCAAKMVYANDLNPSSVKYLNENIRRNSIPDHEKKIVTSCSCASSFLRSLVHEKHIPISRVVMNFPSGAPEFLGTFKGLYNSWDVLPEMPVVHCYCFIKGELDTNEARARVRNALFDHPTAGHSVLQDEDIDVRIVRDVAPNKVQVCVTFTVPKTVAYDKVEQPNTKKYKTDDNKSSCCVC